MKRLRCSAAAAADGATCAAVAALFLGRAMPALRPELVDVVRTITDEALLIRARKEARSRIVARLARLA